MGESVVEERAIGETGQRVVQSLTRKFGRESSLFGDVTHG
jgi:hypothetical protein